MLTIAKIDRYDMLNNPGCGKPAMTIWFTGCSMGCDGCHSKTLWDKSAGQQYTAKGVVFTICSVGDKYDLDTVVLLGGEPLEQDINELHGIVHTLANNGYKIWLYTGWEFEDIPENIKEHLETIKCGKYDKALDQSPKFPASSNQRVLRMIDGAWQEINL